MWLATRWGPGLQAMEPGEDDEMLGVTFSTLNVVTALDANRLTATLASTAAAHKATDTRLSQLERVCDALANAPAAIPDPAVMREVASSVLHEIIGPAVTSAVDVAVSTSVQDAVAVAFDKLLEVSTKLSLPPTPLKDMLQYFNSHRSCLFDAYYLLST